MIEIVIAVFLSYFMGSIPTAFIAGKWLKGIDIREHGSGNMGATNVFRVLGKGPGIVVLVVDILKGVLGVVLVGQIFQFEEIFTFVVLGIASVCGHNWTVFLKFKGGKGIATSLGVLVGLTIKFAVLGPVLGFTLLIWIITFALSAYISLASIIAAIALPLIMVLTHQIFEVVGLGVIFCLFVIFRHKTNIKRLLAGEESQVQLPFHQIKRRK